MALLGPHPALKVAAPQSPMVDGWMGDDWFHYGAFRNAGFGYFVEQEMAKGAEGKLTTSNADDYDAYLRAGSAGDFARAHGLDQFAMWRRMAEHPAYDAYWRGQALDKLVAAKPSAVPTMWIQGLWDQEDMWGAIHSWEALKAAGHADGNYLVMGPWRHSQVNYDGYSLGPLKWSGDTATDFRRDVLLPFFNQYLKDGAPPAATPKVLIYNSGENHWDRLADWPLACQQGCAAPLTRSISRRTRPCRSIGRRARGRTATSPIPRSRAVRPPPDRHGNADQWKPWLVSDQRDAATRPDVLTYETATLTAPVRISGAAIADLFAATTGTDADWVVKLIDVYPDEMPAQPSLAAISWRWRWISSAPLPRQFRASRADPGQCGRALSLRPADDQPCLPARPSHHGADPVELVPLYDRNPQTYVSNIFFAQPQDYRAATMTVSRSAAQASAVWLPLVPGGALSADAPPRPPSQRISLHRTAGPPGPAVAADAGQPCGQSIVSWRIDVDRDARLKPARDGYGNAATMLYIDGPIDRIALSVSGEVLTEDRAGMVSGRAGGRCRPSISASRPG